MNDLLKNFVFGNNNTNKDNINNNNNITENQSYLTIFNACFLFTLTVFILYKIFIFLKNKKSKVIVVLDASFTNSKEKKCNCTELLTTTNSKTRREYPPCYSSSIDNNNCFCGDGNCNNNKYDDDVYYIRKKRMIMKQNRENYFFVILIILIFVVLLLTVGYILLNYHHYHQQQQQQNNLSSLIIPTISNIDVPTTTTTTIITTPTDNNDDGKKVLPLPIPTTTTVIIPSAPPAEEIENNNNNNNNNDDNDEREFSEDDNVYSKIAKGSKKNRRIKNLSISRSRRSILPIRNIDKNKALSEYFPNLIKFYRNEREKVKDTPDEDRLVFSFYDIFNDNETNWEPIITELIDVLRFYHSLLMEGGNDKEKDVSTHYKDFVHLFSEIKVITIDIVHAICDKLKDSTDLRNFNFIKNYEKNRDVYKFKVKIMHAMVLFLMTEIIPYISKDSNFKVYNSIYRLYEPRQDHYYYFDNVDSTICFMFAEYFNKRNDKQFVDSKFLIEHDQFYREFVKFIKFENLEILTAKDGFHRDYSFFFDKTFSPNTLSILNSNNLIRMIVGLDLYNFPGNENMFEHLKIHTGWKKLKKFTFYKNCLFGYDGIYANNLNLTDYQDNDDKTALFNNEGIKIMPFAKYIRLFTKDFKLSFVGVSRDIVYFSKNKKFIQLDFNPQRFLQSRKIFTTKECKLLSSSSSSSSIASHENEYNNNLYSWDGLICKVNDDNECINMAFSETKNVDHYYPIQADSFVLHWKHIGIFYQEYKILEFGDYKVKEFIVMDYSKKLIEFHVGIENFENYKLKYFLPVYNRKRDFKDAKIVKEQSSVYLKFTIHMNYDSESQYNVKYLENDKNFYDLNYNTFPKFPLEFSAGELDGKNKAVIDKLPLSSLSIDNGNVSGYVLYINDDPVIFAPSTIKREEAVLYLNISNNNKIIKFEFKDEFRNQYGNKRNFDIYMVPIKRITTTEEKKISSVLTTAAKRLKN